VVTKAGLTVFQLIQNTPRGNYHSSSRWWPLWPTLFMVRFTSTYAISACHYSKGEIDSH